MKPSLKKVGVLFCNIKYYLLFCGKQNTMKTITEELKRVNFIDDAFYNIEYRYIPSQFNDAFEHKESLNEFYYLEEHSQIGVQLTAQISHAFYSYLKYYANKNFENRDSFLRVVNSRKKDEKLSYDLVLKDLNTQIEYLIEVKLSQNKNSWQGSTSSTSKVDLFLLVNFKIDRDKKLGCEDGGSLFSGVFSGLVNMVDKNWDGSPKKNNHRTKFEFRINEWNLDFLNKNCIIKGGLDSKKTILHLILDELIYEKTQQTYSI
jgi:hypothetical protein